AIVLDGRRLGRDQTNPTDWRPHQPDAVAHDPILTDRRTNRRRQTDPAHAVVEVERERLGDVRVLDVVLDHVPGNVDVDRNDEHGPGVVGLPVVDRREERRGRDAAEAHPADHVVVNAHLLDRPGGQPDLLGGRAARAALHLVLEAVPLELGIVVRLVASGLAQHGEERERRGIFFVSIEQLGVAERDAVAPAARDLAAGDLDVVGAAADLYAAHGSELDAVVGGGEHATATQTKLLAAEHDRGAEARDIVAVDLAVDDVDPGGSLHGDAGGGEFEDAVPHVDLA